MKFSLTLLSILLATPYLNALEIPKEGERWCGMGGFESYGDFVKSVSVFCDDLDQSGHVSAVPIPLKISVDVWTGESAREVIIDNPGLIIGDIATRTDFKKIEAAVAAKLKNENKELKKGAAINVQSVQLEKTERIFGGSKNEELAPSVENKPVLQLDEKLPNAKLIKCAHAWDNLNTERFTEMFTYGGGKNSDPLIVLPPSEDNEIKRDIIVTPKGYIKVDLDKSPGCRPDDLKLVKEGKDAVYISHSHCNSEPANGLAKGYVEPWATDSKIEGPRFKTVDGSQETIDPESKVAEEVLKRIRNVSRAYRGDYDRDIVHRTPKKLARVANALEACRDVKGFYNDEDATKNEMLYFSKYIFPNGYEEFLTKKNQSAAESKQKKNKSS